MFVYSPPRHETEGEDNNEFGDVPTHHQSLLSHRRRRPACHSGNDPIYLIGTCVLLALGVNCINILQAAFCTKSVMRSLFVLTVCAFVFWQKEIGKELEYTLKPDT